MSQESNKKDKQSKSQAISTLAEAKRFDEMLTEYSKKKSGIVHPDYLSLANCWQRIEGHKHGGRIFTAVFDLKLAMVLLNYDAVEISDAKRNIRNSSDSSFAVVNQSADNFFSRVDLHRSANAYIIRYRAIFDKLMGLMILLHSPDDYNGFLKAKSRRKQFKEICRKHPKIFPGDSVDNLIKSITMFDDGYRTSEVHHAGKLRKYSFSFDSKGAEYFGKLQLDSWNYLIEVVRQIDRNVG